MWDLIVSVPDHCLSFYLEKALRSFARSEFMMNNYIFLVICRQNSLEICYG